MECNKDEAIRAKEIAEKKMKSNDFEGAKKIVVKARNLYPGLDNITQLLSICDVHCSAQIKFLGSEKDWYGILQVEKLSDESMVKKQYRRLALVLHPDKNRFPGAESAFKLICEAHAVLSDPAKKSIYDTKIRVSSRSASVNPHNHHSQYNKQGAQNHAPCNGNNSGGNQPPATQSTDVFWTGCPYCLTKYQYLRQFVNKSLRCNKCVKIFTGYEISEQAATKGSKSGQSVRKKPDLSRPAEKVGKDKKRSSASRKTVRPEPHDAKVGGNRKTEETDTLNAKGKKGGTSNKKTVNGEVKNRNTKKGRKAVESSPSCDTATDSDLDMTMEDLMSESGHAHYPRRSSRKRQCTFYTENQEVDPASRVNGQRTTKEVNRNEQKAAAESEDTKYANGNDTPISGEESPQSKDAGCDNEVEDSEQVSTPSDNLDTELCHCPDPEFSDFDKEREETRFEVNQFWACYDTLDGMPRFYAKVKKVCLSPFELSITWLEAVPIAEPYKKWVAKELPVGCGSFKLGKTEKTSIRLSFSHQVHCEKSNTRGSLEMYPRKGEIWALFKNWDLSWSSNPDDHQELKYEIVEVLSDFAECGGVKVVYLNKISGFVSLFERAGQSVMDSFFIRPDEVYKFSHCIPSSKMTGSERQGVPVGSFELDPAALPENPDDVSYPSKVEVECGNITPKKFVDLEAMSSPRRSPRVVFDR